jgi:cbb3-type cytochrome oxidase maturation protein
MSVLFLMIPMAIIFAIGFVGFFIWATQSGQFDDVETPAHRILFDETNQTTGVESGEQ